MNEIGRLIKLWSILVACALISYFPTSGQSNAELKELYDLKTEAIRTMELRPRRIVTKILDLREKATGVVEETVYEFLATDLIRVKKVISRAKEASTFESMIVGEYQYFREDEGPWRKAHISEIFSSPLPVLTAEAGSCSVREVNKGYGFVDSHPTNVFTELAFVNGKNGIVHVVRRTWFALDGSILKETEQRRYFRDGLAGRMFDRLENFDATITYEYEPRIKIEAPIK